MMAPTCPRRRGPRTGPWYQEIKQSDGTSVSGKGWNDPTTNLVIVLGCASLAVISGPADAQTVAVFDFELIDTSLESAMGSRAEEQVRLGDLGDQLRQRPAGIGSSQSS